MVLERKGLKVVPFPCLLLHQSKAQASSLKVSTKLDLCVVMEGNY